MKKVEAGEGVTYASATQSAEGSEGGGYGEEESPYGGRSPYGSESPYGGEVEGGSSGVTEGEVESGGAGGVEALREGGDGSSGVEYPGVGGGGRVVIVP